MDFCPGTPIKCCNDVCRSLMLKDWNGKHQESNEEFQVRLAFMGRMIPFNIGEGIIKGASYVESIAIF